MICKTDLFMSKLRSDYTRSFLKKTSPIFYSNCGKVGESQISNHPFSMYVCVYIMTFYSRHQPHSMCLLRFLFYEEYVTTLSRLILPKRILDYVIKFSISLQNVY